MICIEIKHTAPTKMQVVDNAARSGINGSSILYPYIQVCMVNRLAIILVNNA